ncbi:ClbS/DfsB family four-helix bundle protein [Actinomyces sp. B33]|nr:ClbS/DfsB family four-helix bundle protein [Actinomyces sp. B33]MDC4233821.1 ClbS/DfsB family four-helix bundle protein [Actinomyces sp. B33]
MADYAVLNTEIWEHYHNAPLGQIQEMLTTSHFQIVELIESFTDEELFTKETILLVDRNHLVGVRPSVSSTQPLRLSH